MNGPRVSASAMLFLLACTPETPKPPSGDDTGYVWRDTSPVIDTSDSAVETGDSVPPDTDESGDSSPIDTGDTAAVPWLALQVWPSTLVVHVGATWALRTVGTDPDGVVSDLPSDTAVPTYTSDDPLVATIDAAGVVTATGVGTTTLRVTFEGLEATSTVEVRADGVVTVTVLDGTTGLPIEGARVGLPSSTSIPTDASGRALLAVTDPGAITFSAWLGDDYNAVTLTGVVARELTVSIVPKDTRDRSASVSGAIDFSSVDDAEWTEMVAGFAAASVQGALATTRLEDLFSDTRTLDISGLEVEAPANLFVETIVEDYEATALPGSASVWGLAGPLPLADTLDGLAGTGDALDLLADNLGLMVWGQQNAVLTTADADTTVDLAPNTPFDGASTLDLPALSDGFLGDETWFVLVTEERADDGFVVTGLGSGSPGYITDITTVPLGSVPDSLGTAALATAQVGGIGSGGAVSATVATAGADGTLAFAPPQDILDVTLWNPATRELSFTADVDADLVRIRLRDDRNGVHDIYAPASWSGALPICDTQFRMAGASVEVLAIETSEGTYQGWVGAGDLSLDAKPVRTAARTEE
jgi:hypothetical protein